MSPVTGVEKVNVLVVVPFPVMAISAPSVGALLTVLLV
jgi:hypothetical protein